MDYLGKDSFCSNCRFSQDYKDIVNNKFVEELKCKNKDSDFYDMLVGGVVCAPCHSKFNEGE